MSDTPPLTVPAAETSALGNTLIAVASGKGGVGKTWFAVTLAHALARRGRRVLLFDGDIGLANVDIQLGINPRHDLGTVIDGTVTLHGAVQRFDPGGFDIIAGRSGTGQLATLPSQHLSALRSDLIELARGYDHVVLDLGAGVDRTVRLLAGPAGITLVLVTDEPTSLTDAYAFIKVTRAGNGTADLRVVVNQAANAREGERTYQAIDKACRSFLKFSPPMVGIVRRDPKVREAIRAQEPLLARAPACDAASDILAIAARLTPGP